MEAADGHAPLYCSLGEQPTKRQAEADAAEEGRPVYRGLSQPPPLLATAAPPVPTTSLVPLPSPAAPVEIPVEMLMEVHVPNDTLFNSGRTTSKKDVGRLRMRCTLTQAGEPFTPTEPI